MNEAAHGVGGDEANQPQNYQNNCDGIEHDDPFVFGGKDAVSLRVAPVSLLSGVVHEGRVGVT